MADPKLKEFLEDFQRRKYEERLEKFFQERKEREKRRMMAPTEEAAQGGRIGYDNGGDVDDLLFNQATVWDLFESETGRPPENDDELRDWIKSKSYLEQDTIRQAQFAERRPPPKYKQFPTSSVLLKERSEQYKDYLDRAGEYVSAHGGIGGAAKGGRIGYTEDE